jgi:serine/threonine protein phosphatase 1
MSFTYAIADLHGRYDFLSEAVTKIVEHSKSDRPATIITLGDYVDRGPRSRQVIERLMDWGSPDPQTGLPQGQSRRHHVAVLPSANQGWMVDG